MLIRETTVDDIPDIDAIRRAAEPWHVATIETQRVWFDSNTPESKVLRLCAEVDGRVLGSGWAKLDLHADQPNAGIMALGVHPTVQRQGIGAALLARFEEHLRGIGASQLQVYLVVNDDSVAFAENHGFVLGATNRWIVLDPRVLPPMPEIPSGVTILTAAEAGPQPWYDVVDVAARDEPGDVAFTGMPYEEWFDSQWVTLDKELSLIAFVDGKPAAATALITNHETGKAMSGGTDNLREFRGRGLVKLIKAKSLELAAQAGITAAYTGNDEVNAPMRAINAWLGYEFVGETRSAIKKFA
ncbi:GNAT family N-acetyltransferase [Catelliglobosispora koreensis]|uniref:GNAT family N-acetyltransferase n=1 Tax=Catelliglobosispora koreensis TaxID=129052 RepID=UPI0003800EAC|nr:GNAT family N-acetyltransferase [Catelliglobosispora koreensis]